MKLKLQTKITGLIFGVLALAVASSIVAMVSAWRLQRLMTHTLARNLASVRAAEELQIALLVQRGFVAFYVLDGGNQRWLDELHRREPEFEDWLGKARAAADSDEGLKILHGIELAFRQYDGKRDQVVSLFDDGRAEEAKRVLLDDVTDTYDQVYEQCEQYLTANVSTAEQATEDARSKTKRTMVVVSLLVAMTVALSVALSVLFFREILSPLRRMLVEVESFSGSDRVRVPDQATDELALVGRSLRTLMADVVDTRTSLQRSRDLLMQSEKLATVGRLAASVAHEIRNPLTAMKMWLFSIRRAIPSDADLLRKFDLVSDEIDRLENIVQDFLEFSRRPVHAPKPVDIAELLSRTLELMSHRIREKGVNVVFQADSGLPSPMADAEQLKQVFINLITNAAEAMIRDGEVRVVATAERDDIGIAMVVVRVHDRGGGIPSEVQDRIFEPFFTTKEEGTGLGLCIAAQIMVRHGGRINLESSTPEGSCFAVWLPVEDRG